MDQTDRTQAELDFASLTAHQLRSPIAAVQAFLRAVLGDYAGPLTDRQRDVLAKAELRCEEALSTVGRMLAVTRAMQGQSTDETTELVHLVHDVTSDYHAQAHARGIRLETDVDVDAATVRGSRDALIEVLTALVDNAFKYTPDRSFIRVTLGLSADASRARLIVADSGPGVPEAEREKVFEAFYRSDAARRSANKGTGLGLSFVKAVVESFGGTVQLQECPDLGGASFAVELPLAESAETAGVRRDETVFKVVIVGGVAAGPKVASKVIRMMPEARVTVVEKGEVLSYAGCGLPYYVSGVVRDQKELLSTAAGAVRDPVFFQKVKNVEVLGQHEAVSIDRAERSVHLRDVVAGRTRHLHYDKLVLATGARPIVPKIPGVDLRGVYSLHGVADAEGIRAALAEGRARDVAIVGGGLIGVEITEALVRSGSRVTIVEKQNQILTILDWEMARLVEHYLETQGVRVMTETEVTEIIGSDEGTVAAVETSRGRYPAQMVILAVGVRPNVELAREAGLELGVTGAVKVDDHMRTSDPDIYAAGDCTEMTDLLTGKPTYVPLGSTANKQGRVAAVNIAGGDDTFPGVLGSTICKVFDYRVGRTGLTEAQARAEGHDVVTALAPGPDRAHYMPEAGMLLMKMIADRKSRKLLGLQTAGPGAGDKRIDVAAMALTCGMTVDEMAQADLCYCPPYSPAMDNITTAANIIRNKLAGYMTGITPMDLKAMMDERPDEVLLLDVRSPAEYGHVRLPGSHLVPLGSLRSRLDELPRDKTVVTTCSLSLRGYEASLILRAAGFEDVRVLDGGVAMWPFRQAQSISVSSGTSRPSHEPCR